MWDQARVERWEETRKRGEWHYVLSRGSVLGIIFGCLNLITDYYRGPLYSELIQWWVWLAIEISTSLLFGIFFAH